jgi:hypothetical protein
MLKACLRPLHHCDPYLKSKGAKNSYGGYQTEFAGSTQNLKKITGTPNLPIKTKIIQIKVCLVKRSQKFVWELPEGICPGSPKNNRTQVTFRKP